ncbi:MAG: hypothetical protein ACLSWY_04240 [Ruthenibacterium lactatiformans]
MTLTTMTRSFARENGLLFSGSDHHETEDRGRGGMVLPRRRR